jgi:hypothetical protein
MFAQRQKTCMLAMALPLECEQNLARETQNKGYTYRRSDNRYTKAG